MDDFMKAKNIFQKGNHNLVAVKDNIVHTSTKSGVAPMLNFIDDGTDLVGFSVADKIVGKAAAMLFAYAGVINVYGDVMSQSAVDFFDKHYIKYEYNVLTDRIINRNGDGICPMEQAVGDIDYPEMAVTAIKEKIYQLRKGAGR